MYCCSCQLLTDLQESTTLVIQKQQGGVDYLGFPAQSCYTNLCLSLPQEKSSVAIKLLYKKHLKLAIHYFCSGGLIIEKNEAYN